MLKGAVARNTARRAVSVPPEPAAALELLEAGAGATSTFTCTSWIFPAASRWIAGL